jgi:hypothetical protein
MFNRKQKSVLPYTDLIPAFYCRVSSDEQAEHTNVSIPDQIKATQGYAQRLAMQTYDDFVLLEDEKGSTLDRPQLHRLRQLIKDRRINAVIVRSTDRLSRSPGNGEILFDEMSKHNIRFFVTMHQREFDLASINDRDMLLQEMMFNRRWLKMLTDTMAWGKRGRIERGNPAMGGEVKYGFSKWKDADKQWHYELHGNEAPTIQSIFHWLVIDHIGVLEIRRRLKGKPTPKELRVSPEKLQNIKKRASGEWSLSSIYNILRDPAYKGELVLYRNSNEYEPVTIQIPMIVSPEIWDAAQVIINNGKKKSPRNAKYDYLLARLISCECQAILHTEQVRKRNGDGYYRYYRCNRGHGNQNYADRYCPAPIKTWHADELDAALWAWLTEVCEHPELLQAYLEESKQRSDVVNEPILARIQQLDDTRKRWEQKLLNLLNLYAAYDLNDPRYKTERLMLERARDEATVVFNDIEHERTTLQQRIVHQSISTHFIDSWVEAAQRIREKMHTFPFEKRRQAVESLGITVSPVTQEGKRFLLVYIYEQYAEKLSLDDSNTFHCSSNLWNECQILLCRIPLP